MLPSYKRKKGRSAALCRLALARGPLTPGAKGSWRFRDRRGFASWIVAELIAAGEAVRHGDRVVRAEPGRAP